MLADGFLNQGLLTDTAALAAVALIGYLFGRQQRRPVAPVESPFDDELARAGRIADQVAVVTADVGREAKIHAREVARFQAQVAAMQCGDAGADWHRLREQADQLLGPTLKLATTLTLACEQLRRQQAQLITFSASRVDPATGLHNRRSLEEQLAAFFSIHAAGKRRFSLAMFSISPAGTEAPETSEDRLRRVARLLQDCLRDDDFVARYSFDEFVVLMPQTPLGGALAFGERLLVRAAADVGYPMWGGVVEAVTGESSDKLLSRADSALYSARAAGAASLFQHTGAGVRRHAVNLEPATGDGEPQHELAAL